LLDKYADDWKYSKIKNKDFNIYWNPYFLF
jgi:hypothetical protein